MSERFTNESVSLSHNSFGFIKDKDGHHRLGIFCISIFNIC